MQKKVKIWTYHITALGDPMKTPFLESKEKINLVIWTVRKIPFVLMEAVL